MSNETSRRDMLKTTLAAAGVGLMGLPEWSAPVQAQGAMVYLQITLKISGANRPAAVEIYEKYKSPFLNTIAGAKSKSLLVRDEDVQVLHGFDSREQAEAYLKSPLFTADVVGGLKPLLDDAPDVRIYQVA